MCYLKLFQHFWLLNYVISGKIGDFESEGPFLAITLKYSSRCGENAPPPQSSLDFSISLGDPGGRKQISCRILMEFGLRSANTMDKSGL